jgi:hypothetical protein
MFHFAHLYNFTPDTLRMVAAKAGFRVTRWLSRPGDKNLRVLLTGHNRSDWSVDPASYPRALRAMTGRGTLRYHVRWSYLRQRIPTLWQHRWDHLLAHWRVRQILHRSRAGRWQVELAKAA